MINVYKNKMKYIVYKTTNLVNGKIYVGVHKTMTPYEFDGYLGCGVVINDKHTYKDCNTPFEAAVNKYGIHNFKRETLAVYDTMQEALDLEIKIVDEEFIRRKDTYNITLGGGMPPITTKIVYQYSMDGNFIKEWQSLMDVSRYYNCSSSCVGDAVLNNTPSLGFLWTDYKRDIIDISKFKINRNKKTVYIYDLNGTYLNQYISIAECAKSLSCTKKQVSNSIHRKCMLLKTYYCSDIKYDKLEIPKPIDRMHNPIYQYDLDGNFIKEWASINELNLNDIELKKLRNAIDISGVYDNYQWSWYKVDSMSKRIYLPGKRKVGMYSLDGELLQIFDSVTNAMKHTRGSINVLRGRDKTSGGYIWKYIDQ